MNIFLFFEGGQQPKNRPKTPENAFSDALLMSRFQNFAAGTTLEADGFCKKNDGANFPADKAISRTYSVVFTLQKPRRFSVKVSYSD